MTDRITPAVIAALAGAVVAVLVFVPYVALLYRRRGDAGPGRMLLGFGALVYALALLAYVLLPFPPDVPDFCARYGVGVGLRPLQFVDDIAREPGSLLHNAAALGVMFNVVLFVPLGALLRHLTGRGVVAVTVIGLAVSMLVELTQLTGIWGLYPCPYRLFDVDDLLTNTTGALLGGLLAPALRLVPGQGTGAPAAAARPVTSGRRLLGMACDLLAVVFTGSALVLVLRVLMGALAPDSELPPGVEPLVTWLVPALGQLALVLAHGTTLGERAVLLAPATRTVLDTRVTRWATGIGGWCLLQLPGGALAGWLALALVGASLVAAFRSRGHRGLAYVAVGLDVADARAVTAPEAVR